VREHGGEFVARSGHRDQAEVHADIAAGQRERIDASVAHQEHLPREARIGLGVDVAALACRSDQRFPDRLQVLEQQRVIEVVRVAPDVAHHLFAQPPLGARPKITRHRVAERGQRYLGLQPRRSDR
jgi:hypothetical protein